MSLNGIVFGWLQLNQATIAEAIWLKFGILVLRYIMHIHKVPRFPWEFQKTAYNNL